MGTVYLAEHPDIGRKVAVKVLRSDFSRDSQVLGRFINEARAANAIRHPNIIEILDSGTTLAGVSYLVMELLEGESLSARLKRFGPLAVREASEIAYQTASAVGAAHSKGIVHRDLKPDNLFVIPEETDPSRERVKVLDFGIAKLQVTGSADSVKTRTGTTMGTPIYMSPEQCLGTKEVDHRSDIYSLGVILFEMLCGRPPFVSEGFGELVNMHLNVAPPAPRSLRPELSETMEAIVLKMLAKKPDQRFSNLSEVQTALKETGAPGFPVRGTSSPHLPETLAAGIAATMQSVSRGPTTLSNITGQLSTTATTRGRWAAAAAVTAVAVVIVVAVWFGRSDSSMPSSQATVPATAPTKATPSSVKTIRISVGTEPPGARVRRADTGELWGDSPVTKELPAGQGHAALEIDKDGFALTNLSVPLTENHVAQIVLEKKSAAKPKGAKPKEPRHRPSDDEPAKM